MILRDERSRAGHFDLVGIHWAGWVPAVTGDCPGPVVEGGATLLDVHWHISHVQPDLPFQCTLFSWSVSGDHMCLCVGEGFRRSPVWKITNEVFSVFVARYARFMFLRSASLDVCCWNSKKWRMSLTVWGKEKLIPALTLFLLAWKFFSNRFSWFEGNISCGVKEIALCRN